MSSTETGSGEKFLIVRVSHRFQKGPRPGERLGLSKPDEPKRDKTRLVWSSPKSMHRHFATLRRSAHSSSGLGHRPLTAAARVRIPYGPYEAAWLSGFGLAMRVRWAGSAAKVRSVGTPVGTPGFWPNRQRERVKDHVVRDESGFEHGDIRCAERRREVDEFTAIAEKWGYWSDGVGKLVPFWPGVR